MAKISGFTDEVSSDLDEQIEAARAIGAHHVALRGCFDKNVMEWSDAECERIRAALDAAGIGVSEIGFPVGKSPIDEPFERTAEALARAIELARLFEAPYIRMFSFYPPTDGGDILAHRAEVLDRLNAMCLQVEYEPVTLVLENEANLYGDYPAQCVDIFAHVVSKKMRMAFDFANFVSRKPIRVLADAWRPLKPYVCHIHVKDHLPGARHACVAGEGAGDVEPILAELSADGYDGFLTLEPHLQRGGPTGGFSGLENFKRAADALRSICERVGLPLE